MHRIRKETKTVVDPQTGDEVEVVTIFHEYTNNCRFCSKECGFVTFGNERPELEDSLETLGYVDTRCDDCGIEHGNYKEMEATFRAKVSEDHGEFRDAMEQAGYSNKNFPTVVAAIRELKADQWAKEHPLPEVTPASEEVDPNS